MDKPDDKPQHSIGGLILVVIDVILVLGAFLTLGFVVPVFEEMFRDFGAPLPPPTQFVMNISRLIMANYGAGLVFLTGLMVFGIVWTYITLHQQRKRATLFATLWAIFVAVVLLLAAMTCMMFSPLCRTVYLTGGPMTESPSSPNHIVVILEQSLEARKGREWKAVKIDLAHPFVVVTHKAKTGSTTILHAWPETQNDFNVPMIRFNSGAILYEITKDEYRQLEKLNECLNR